MAIAHASLEADVVLRLGLTPADHPWPRFPISVPTRGKAYGQSDARGFIQLDLVGRVGWGILRTYELTGEKRLLHAARHWADVFAAKRDRKPGADPWGRYANPEAVLAQAGINGFRYPNPEHMPWKDNKLTGGIVWILYFLDEVIRTGYTGADNGVVVARDAARAYLRDKLLPVWTVNDTWGRQYWDWNCPVQVPNITAFVARYMMDHKDVFPNWRTDARNILALCLNRACVNPASNGDVYSGAWATPESNLCCGRCLSAGPVLAASAWARYGAEANSEWAREIARRQTILLAYDAQDTGVSEDNIDGGIITNGAWFESAHMAPMKAMLGAMAWLPETLGAARENHIMRSTAVVNAVEYGKGRVAYSTFDAPANTVDVLRLAFKPSRVSADGRRLLLRRTLAKSAYTLRQLKGNDWILSVQHDGAKHVVVEGSDAQQVADVRHLLFKGMWRIFAGKNSGKYPLQVSETTGASCTWRFNGNQIRIIGSASPTGGLADVYLDGVRQIAGIDTWCPSLRMGQVLYSRSGLRDGAHSVRVVVLGTHNPVSKGNEVALYEMQWASGSSACGFGEGGGPTDTQRMLFGYTGRKDFVDSRGQTWRPGLEFVVRSGAGTDSVASWWTTRFGEDIANTTEPELYRYGVHAPEFWVNATVGPGHYKLRLRFAATHFQDTSRHCVTVFVNGRKVASNLDIAALAGGRKRAFDLSVEGITPRKGIINIRFVGSDPATGAKEEAFVQAIEIERTGGTDQ